jgi:hypothetical protein
MKRAILFFSCSINLICGQVHAAGERLYGVHWWEYANPTVGSGPQGGWSVETIVTESEAWWRAPWFVPLYQQVTTTYNAEIITRVDYNWGQTVPAPSTSSASAWATKIINEVIGPLGPYAKRWIIGNEPNIVGEGNGWPANQITPSGYAQIYHTVRQAIRAVRPQDEVLFAPVSPGGVIAGVRWKDGNEWLAEAIDATLALPDAGIDGFAIHAYGNPFVGAAQAVSEFHNTYVSQLAVIDSRNLRNAPVYLTEWNRATSTTGNLSANEQVTADFLRQAIQDVDAWNRIPGNHNIRSMAWFVNEDHGGWSEYSLKWWKSQGNPPGHPGDLWTALMDSHVPLAGLAGSRPLTDYNSDGVVNHGDWLTWRTHFGRANWVYADGNRNGLVDAADYILWRKTTQLTTGNAARIAAPEMDTWRVLAFVFGILLAIRSRTTESPGLNQLERLVRTL